MGGGKVGGEEGKGGEETCEERDRHLYLYTKASKHSIQPPYLSSHG